MSFHRKLLTICSFVRLRNVVSQAVTDIAPVDLQEDFVHVRPLGTVQEISQE